jgi:hypothetical protein
LQGFDAVDVDEGNVNGAVRVGVDDDDSVSADGDKLRVPDLMTFAVGKPQLERFKRLMV